MKVFKLIKGKIIALKLTAIVNSNIVLVISEDKTKYKITLPHKARTNSHGLDYYFKVYSLMENKWIEIGEIFSDGVFNKYTKNYHGHFTMEAAQQLFFGNFKEYAKTNTNFHDRIRRVNHWLNNYFNRK